MASGEANSFRQGKLGDVWPASPTTLTRFYRFVPLRQVQARPTHYNSELSLCSAGGHSYVTSLEVFRDGMVRSGAQYPRDALSKGCNIQEFSVVDTLVGSEKHCTHCTQYILDFCTNNCRVIPQIPYGIQKHSTVTMPSLWL